MSSMDDLTTGLTKAKRTPWLTRGTAVMFGLVLMCGGFLAGIKVQQAYGSSTPTAQAPVTNRSAQQPAAAVITGKVKLVDGTTVYVETADGRLITVKTSATTVVATKAELKNLPVGASVTVQGTGSETVTASSIVGAP